MITQPRLQDPIHAALASALRENHPGGVLEF